MNPRGLILFIAILLALVSAHGAMAADMPAEVRKLVEIRERELYRINILYRQRLHELLAGYVTASDTENTNLIKRLIADAETKPESAKEAGAKEHPKLAALVGK